MIVDAGSDVAGLWHGGSDDAILLNMDIII
jgi:hypothetical protein